MNFLHFKPGLVGGHCISVDPYYLTHRPKSWISRVILTGRRITMDGSYVATQLVKELSRKKIRIDEANI